MAANQWGVETLQGGTQNDAATARAARERRQALIVPREHGAWADTHHE